MAKTIKTTKRIIKYPDEVEKLLKRPIKHKRDPNKDKEVADKNASLFKQNLKAIRKANKDHDYGEIANLAVYKAMLDMVLDLIPIAEENYRKYKIDKSAYALGSYLNHAREILVDIRAIKDFSEQLELINRIVRKQFTQIVQQLVEETFLLKKELVDSLGAPSRRIVENKIESLIKSHGKYMNESVKMIDAQLTSLLLEQEPVHKRRKSGTTVKRGG